MTDKAEVARKNRRRGKRMQKRANKEFGAENVGIFGGEDGKDATFSLEQKSREKFSGLSWMEQAIKNCPKGKIPIVQVHVKGKLYKDDIIMIRLDDFKKLKEVNHET